MHKNIAGFFIATILVSGLTACSSASEFYDKGFEYGSEIGSEIMIEELGGPSGFCSSAASVQSTLLERDVTMDDQVQYAKGCLAGIESKK